MKTGLRVLLVGPASDGRERAAAELSDVDVTVRVRLPTGDGAAADYDCVVGVPGSREATALACELGEVAPPAVLFVDADCPVDGLLENVADVVRRGPGAGDLLAQRVQWHARAHRESRARARVARADGGTETGAEPTGPLLERMTDGLVSLGADWTIQYCNDAARSLLGGPTEPVVGEPFWEVFPGFEGTAIGETCREAMETQEAGTVEGYHEPLATWFEVRAYPDEDGLSLFFRDVSERRRARGELAASEESVRRLHDIVSDTDLSGEEKLERMLEVGRDRLGVDLGFLTRIDGDEQEIVAAVGDHEKLQPGETAPLSEAYCRRTIEREKPLAVMDAAESGWGDDPAYQRFQLACYVGAHIDIEGDVDRTICFADSEPRERAFSDSEEAFVELLSDWVRYLVEQRNYESELRAQRRRLETVTENVPVVLFALDPAGTYTFSRGRGLEALGFEPGEVVGESIFDLYGDYPAVTDHAERALDGENVHHTVELNDRVLEVWYQPVHEGDDLQQVVGVARDITEYERQQEALERERAFVESILDSLPDPLYALDEADRLVRWNDQLTRVTGYDDGEIEGKEALELVAAHDRERVAEAFARVADGEQVSVEADIETKAGDYLPYELSGAPMYEDGEVVGTTGVARDVSEQQAHREMLSGLLDATGSLMQARDREEVADIVATAARDVLGFDINLVRLYEPDEGTLRPAARTEATASEMGERPVYEIGEANPGEVFASGKPRVVEDVAETSITAHGGVRSAMYQPMGVHGTISVGATEPDAFDETDQQTLALLATAAAAACTRAKREREVREAREHTETVLNRINGLIENTVEVLVGATTREELEAGVVDQLAAAAPYSFAWIGKPDVASESLSPSTWSGTTPPDVDVSFDLTGDGPVATAYQTGTPKIVQDGGDLPVAGAASEGTVEAAIVIPLVYKETTYGVLAVFADEAGAFDEREQVVLRALGRAVANAINAVERGRIMDATEIIELEFTVTDSDLLFCRLSQGADCRVEVAGTDYQPDGSIRLYLTAEGVDGERLAALAREDEDVTEAVVIADHDEECLLELTVSESLLSTLSEYGAVASEVVGEAGTTRVTVELPYEAEAREVFELVENQYPSTDLVGYHERERPVETRQEFRAALAERFTDRQETALRTAYLGGFFEWPREIDGNELAGAMDISRPTYHQHLRAAQRKVFEELFE